MHKVNIRATLDIKSFLNISSLNVYMCSAPFRWKQYETYVQVLEAKYADLCCKCHTNIQ